MCCYSMNQDADRYSHSASEEGSGRSLSSTSLCKDMLACQGQRSRVPL